MHLAKLQTVTLFVAGALSLATARTIVLSQPSGHKVLHV